VDPVADVLGVAEEPASEADDALGDALDRPAIRQTVEPILKGLGLSDFDHVSLIDDNCWFVN